MKDELVIVSHYLPITPKDVIWGLCVTGTGTSTVPPKCIYTVNKTFDHGRKKGRILTEFGLVYLANGRGVFESKDTGSRNVEARDVFLLFPGIWHNYRPHPNTGWQEYWLLFQGIQPERLVEHRIISPRSPIYRTQDPKAIQEQIGHIISIVSTSSAGSNHVIAVIAAHILASLVTTSGYCDGTNSSEARISEAKRYLEDNIHQVVDMGELADSLNLSYRHFSRLFKDLTGLPPQRYHIQIRINRAKKLLEHPNAKVSEVAAIIGFEDPYYFSRLFRKYTGLSPHQWQMTHCRM